MHSFGDAIKKHRSPMPVDSTNNLAGLINFKNSTMNCNFIFKIMELKFTFDNDRLIIKSGMA
ncbi:hypothetical protein B9Z48_15235 [Limnohabitans sp. WS1]|nr:hypothetical protein B9Z48_15235 [Limnohabitans sp. WS1]